MKANRLWLIIPWALFALIAAAWIGYWHFVAGQAEQQIQAWAQRETARGGQASYSRIVRHGFPVLMRLEIQDFTYAPARSGWRANTAKIDLNIEVLNPRHVIAAAKAPIQIVRRDAISILAARALIAGLELRDGALLEAGVEGDDITLDDPAKPGALRIGKLVVNVRPDARAAGDYQTAFEARDIVLTRPVRSFEAFGLNAPLLRAAIVATHGAELMHGEPGDALAPWRDAGGVLRFEAIEIHWGPLQATGAGQGGVDDQHRLTGHLTLPIEHPAPIFTALANAPNLDPDAKRALTLLGAGYAISGDSLNLDVDAQNGVLRLEGLPVRSLPPAY